MNVKLINITDDAEEQIVEIARVSSNRKDKQAESSRLIAYLIRNKHWSPFEHAHLTVEIETSRGIAAQLLRHRSFSFQEFSQRYQDVDVLDEGEGVFEHVELREAGATNRQSSTKPFDEDINYFGETKLASEAIKAHMEDSKELYDTLIDAGVATECARFVLPLAVKTKIHMTGNIRSWIHFLELRLDEHAQKEVRLIAQQVKNILYDYIPHVMDAIYNPSVPSTTRKKRVVLSDKDRKAIRKTLKKGKATISELAAKYNVVELTIKNIAS